jgi:hypothetical protein
MLGVDQYLCVEQVWFPESYSDIHVFCCETPYEDICLEEERLCEISIYIRHLFTPRFYIFLIELACFSKKVNLEELA